MYSAPSLFPERREKAEYEQIISKPIPPAVFYKNAVRRDVQNFTFYITYHINTEKLIILFRIFSEPRSVSVAKRDSKRVRGVVGTGNFTKMQKRSNDVLHLNFICLAVARQRLLYLIWRILVQPSAVFYAGKKHNAPCVSNGNTRSLCSLKKTVLDGYFFGFEFIE